MSETKHACVESDPSDEALMIRYVDGDAVAFDVLFGRYEPRAYAFFLERTGSHERAEDLYQELFLRIHRARDSYDRERPFRPWFFQIARYLLIDDSRLKYRAVEAPSQEREWATAECGPEARLTQRQELVSLLSALSPDERRVLVATKVEGIGYAELAEHLDKSAGAVRKMVSRSILRLRKALGSTAPDARDLFEVPASNQRAA
jgi:RNA polymerase sigma-70 factor (ECF subfamily)